MHRQNYAPERTTISPNRMRNRPNHLCVFSHASRYGVAGAPGCAEERGWAGPDTRLLSARQPRRSGQDTTPSLERLCCLHQASTGVTSTGGVIPSKLSAKRRLSFEGSPPRGRASLLWFFFGSFSSGPHLFLSVPLSAPFRTRGARGRKRPFMGCSHISTKSAQPPLACWLL